jgi:GTPase involved in cell partitioning and DNA repair
MSTIGFAMVGKGQKRSRDTIEIEAYDAPGQPLYLKTDRRLRHAGVIVLVLDQSNPSSLNYLRELDEIDARMAPISQLYKETYFIIALNKCDLDTKLIADQDVKNLATKLHCEQRVFHISAIDTGEHWSAEFERFVEACHTWASENANRVFEAPHEAPTESAPLGFFRRFLGKISPPR